MVSIKHSYNKGEFEERLVGKYGAVARASTAAAQETAETLKKRSRTNIAAAGFGPKWQNTLRVESYPKGDKKSANAAVFLYHKIPYSDVFESGATIRGNQYLWLPLKTTPKKLRNKRVTPRLLKQEGVDLVSLRTGRLPLIGAKLSLPFEKRNQSKPKLSITQLQAANIKSKRGMPSRTVPLFFGVSKVSIRKRFAIERIAQEEANLIAERYVKHFRDIDTNGR